MKTPLLLAAAVCLGLMLAPIHPQAEAAATTFEIDAGHSTILFKINHMGVGYQYGRFNEFSGTIQHDAANPAGCSVNVSVKAESLDTNSDKRDAHLRGPDFFNTKQFPTITFASTKIEKSGEDMRVTGDLTLHGVKRSVTVRMKKIGEGDRGPRFGYRMGFEGILTIKRSDHGMTTMVPNIGDEVTLTLAFETVRK